MFNMITGNNAYHPSCHENLCKAFKAFSIDHHLITATFNIFMNFEISETEKIVLKTPLNKKTDFIIFQAFEDVYVGLTACSDPATNAGSCKKIQYAISSFLAELV